MSMVGGTSLRMSPNRSQRHSSSLASDFKRQMIIKAKAQQRYAREQLLLTRSMQTKMKQNADQKQRHQLRENQKRTNQQARFMRRPASAGSRAVRTRSGTLKSPRVVYRKTPIYVNQQRDCQQSPQDRPMNRSTRRRPFSANSKRRTTQVSSQQNNPNWQIIGARVEKNGIQQLRRPTSAPKGRSEETGNTYVYAPTIIRARMSPRTLRTRRPQSAGTRSNQHHQQPQPQQQQGGQQRDPDWRDRSDPRYPSKSKKRRPSTSRGRRSKYSTSTASSKMSRPTRPSSAGARQHGEISSIAHRIPTVQHGEDNSAINSIIFDEFDMEAVEAMEAMERRKQQGSGEETIKMESPPAPSPPRRLNYKGQTIETATKRSLKAPSWTLKRRSVPSREDSLALATKNHTKMKQTFATVQFSALSAACQQVGGVCKWHLTAVEFLQFCKHDIGIESMTLEEAQVLCCNRPLGRGDGFENIFNAKACVSVFGVPTKNKSSKSGAASDPVVGDIKSSSVSQWEIEKGPNAFGLEYADFRDRFWNPVPKPIRDAIDALGKEQATSKKGKEKEEKRKDSRIPPTWIPKVEHYDKKLQHFRSEHLQDDAIREEHVKFARRMKRLYTSIRKGIKRRHLSCAVAFSNFSLSMGPTLSIEQLSRVAKLSASQVLTSPAIHMKSMEFIQSLCSLAEKFIASIAYDARARVMRIDRWQQNKNGGGGGKGAKFSGHTTISGSVDLLRSRIFLQWLCLNRFDYLDVL